jgi:hypothetical protein
MGVLLLTGESYSDSAIRYRMQLDGMLIHFNVS